MSYEERQREIAAEIAAWPTMTEAERKALVLANILQFHPSPVEQLIAEGALLPEAVEAARERAEEIIEERRLDVGVYRPAPLPVPIREEPAWTPPSPWLAPVTEPARPGSMYPLPLLFLMLSLI